jgi:KaiC/GvpD/RAD55 family RecA-like ATPase
MTSIKKERENFEYNLAASILYYDQEEITSFINFWYNIESIPELAASAPFNNFVKYITEISKKTEFKSDSKDIIRQVIEFNVHEPSKEKREQFTIWFNHVISIEDPSQFELSDDIINHYLWLYFLEKVDLVNKSSMPFSEKLRIRPLEISLNKKNQLVKHLNDITNFDITNFYTTGLDFVDDYVKLIDTNFFVIAARPGVGKSIFMLNMTVANALKGIKSAFFSLEMSDSQIKKRIINCYKGYDVDPDEYSKIEQEENYKKINDNIFVIDNSINNGDTIISIAKDLIDRENIKLVFIDYLQLVKFNNLDEWACIRKATSEFKRLANGKKVLVGTATQVSRESTQYGLELSSLFGSSSIEADTDVVIGLEDSDRDMGDTDEASILVKILKNREGAKKINTKTILNYVSMKFTQI